MKTAAEHPAPALPAVILAGGSSRRMGGGDKALLPLGERTVLDHVIERLRPQVVGLAINANGDASRFDRFGLPVVADSLQGRPGPLAGVLAGLEWMVQRFPAAQRLLTVAADMPFLPEDLVHRLAAAETAGLVCAASAGRLHPVVALWPSGLQAALRHALLDQGIRKVTDFIAGQPCIVVDFPVGEVDPFFNINRPEDLASARHLMGRCDPA